MVNKNRRLNMRKSVQILFFFIFVIIVFLSSLQCGSSNRLREYELRDKPTAAIMITPPHAQVVTESVDDGKTGSLLGEVIKIGTTIARDIEAQKAQERLNSAMLRVDIPERIREETLQKSAEYLYFRPINESKEADFVFIMDIKKYGIEAKSWDSSVYFRMNVKVRLIDNKSNVEIWKKSFKEKHPVKDSMFHLGETAGNVITGVALSKLSKKEMIAGFSNLADYMANRIAEKIHQDFIDAHSE